MNQDKDQSRGSRSYSGAFGLGIGLNLAYVIAEAGFGIAVNSAALLADAGHNFGDVLGLALAWGGAYLARTPTSNRRTYGMRKATVMAAFLNSVLLLIAVGAILLESIRRLVHPEPVGGATMMIVAGAGVVLNSFTALLFIKGRERDINIQGAFVHMAADAAVSLGVVGGGLLIHLTGITRIDPIMSMLIGIFITIGTWGLLRDSFHLSMDAVPKAVVLDEVREYLGGLEGVAEVHDLHVWAISTTEIALTAHLVVPMGSPGRDERLLASSAMGLRSKFGIAHSTIQIETSGQGGACEDANV